MSYKKVIITKFGGPDVLSVVVEDTLPKPRKGEVRIKALATSACFTDTMIRKGIYYGIKQKPPFTPGYDVVGVVDELGEGVIHLEVGQRVSELTVTGAYSEYLCIPAEHCVPVPDTVDVSDAVSMVLTYMTAYQMLHRMAKVDRGARILIHGASGAVGTALIQLAVLHGLEIYGTASAKSGEFVSSLGAIPIDYQTEDFVRRLNDLNPQGVDAVFDAIGGANFKRSFQCLRSGGVLVAYGSYNSAIGRESGAMLGYMGLMFKSFLAADKSASIYSIVPGKEKHPDWFHDDLEELMRLLEQGKIKPVISKKLSLTDARTAHQILEARGVIGKIVLLMDGSPSAN